MNRFFRTAYAATLVYLCLAFSVALITGIGMPFPAFSCLYFGLMLFLMPGISYSPAGQRPLFYLIGAVTAFSGFLPIAIARCPLVHWLIHLAGIGAAAAFLLTLRHRTTHALFLKRFRLISVLIFILIGAVCVTLRMDIFRAGEASERYAAVSLAANGAVPYAIVLLTTGVLLLRGLRAQPGRMIDERIFNRRQLRDTFVFAVLVTLVFAADPFVYLEEALSFLREEAIRPFLRSLARLLALLLPSLSSGKLPEKQSVSSGEGTGLRPVPKSEFVEVQEGIAYRESDPPLSVDRDIMTAAMALIVLFILAVLALLIRKLIKKPRKRGRDRGSGYPRETYEDLPSKEGKGREGRPKKRNGDPRERIRYLYGEFLRCLRARRVRFGETNTCGEIRQAAKPRSAAARSALSELTALYEAARYRMREAPSTADADEMRDLLDRIKKGPDIGGDDP